MPNSASQMHDVCCTSCKARPKTLALARNFNSIMYIVIGTFAETSSPEHQLHWIVENCKVVRATNGLSNIVEAMKIACSKHDLLWYVTHEFGCLM